MMLVGLGSKVLVKKEEWVVASIHKDGVTLKYQGKALKFTLKEFEELLV